MKIKVKKDKETGEIKSVKVDDKKFVSLEDLEGFFLSMYDRAHFQDNHSSFNIINKKSLSERLMNTFRISFGKTPQKMFNRHYLSVVKFEEADSTLKQLNMFLKEFKGTKEYGVVKDKLEKFINNFLY